MVITKAKDGRVKVFPDPATENTDYIEYKEWVDAGNTPEGDTD